MVQAHLENNRENIEENISQCAHGNNSDLQNCSTNSDLIIWNFSKF